MKNYSNTDASQTESFFKNLNKLDDCCSQSLGLKLEPEQLSTIIVLSSSIKGLEQKIDQSISIPSFLFLLEKLDDLHSKQSYCSSFKDLLTKADAVADTLPFYISSKQFTDWLHNNLADFSLLVHCCCQAAKTTSHYYSDIVLKSLIETNSTEIHSYLFGRLDLNSHLQSLGYIKPSFSDNAEIQKLYKDLEELKFYYLQDRAYSSGVYAIDHLLTSNSKEGLQFASLQCIVTFTTEIVNIPGNNPELLVGLKRVAENMSQDLTSCILSLETQERFSDYQKIYLLLFQAYKSHVAAPNNPLSELIAHSVIDKYPKYIDPVLIQCPEIGEYYKSLGYEPKFLRPVILQNSPLQFFTDSKNLKLTQTWFEGYYQKALDHKRLSPLLKVVESKGELKILLVEDDILSNSSLMVKGHYDPNAKTIILTKIEQRIGSEPEELFSTFVHELTHAACYAKFGSLTPYYSEEAIDKMELERKIAYMQQKGKYMDICLVISKLHTFSNYGLYDNPYPNLLKSFAQCYKIEDREGELIANHYGSLALNLRSPSDLMEYGDYIFPPEPDASTTPLLGKTCNMF